MKEIPILFSTSMVQATLDGRKTKTRRLRGLEDVNSDPEDWRFVEIQSAVHNGKDVDFFWFLSSNNSPLKLTCPYGKPGDVLWVRETIFAHPAYNAKDLKTGECGPLFDEGGNVVAFRGYVADGDYTKPFRKIPGIHMPKSACRIWLEVVSVRVERLQEITEQDAIAEGIERSYSVNRNPGMAYKNYYPANNGGPEFATARWSFESLWESINGHESLLANPFVWCVAFKRIEKPQKTV